MMIFLQELFISPTCSSLIADYQLLSLLDKPLQLLGTLIQKLGFLLGNLKRPMQGTSSLVLQFQQMLPLFFQLLLLDLQACQLLPRDHALCTMSIACLKLDDLSLEELELLLDGDPLGD